jgi:hypothetical protein
MTNNNWKSPLVPDGRYDLGFIEFSTRLMNGRNPKLHLRFGITEIGDHFGVELTKYYGVNRAIGSIGINGGFQAGQKSNFLREFLTLFPDQQILRLDRIPMSCFKGVIVRGEVVSVTHGSDQRKIPKQLQYSVINRLIKVKRV